MLAVDEFGACMHEILIGPRCPPPPVDRTYIFYARLRVANSAGRKRVRESRGKGWREGGHSVKFWKEGTMKWFKNCSRKLLYRSPKS